MNGAGHDNSTYDETLIQGGPEPDDDVELSEELADTATIEQLFDTFIQAVSEMFHDTLDVSLEGNPVKTHFELQAFGQDTVELAYELRRELVARVANRAEEIAEEGNLLRKQVIEES